MSIGAFKNLMNNPFIISAVVTIGEGKKENGEEKEDKKEGWGQRVEPVAMDDHPNDSGTELLFREHGNTSVSLEIFLSVCIHHVKICILCECMSIS